MKNLTNIILGKIVKALNQNGVKKSALTLFLAFSALFSFAAEEKRTSSIQLNTASVNDQLNVQNRFYGSTANYLTNQAQDGKFKVKLFFDRNYESTPSLFVGNTSFEVVVNYKVDLEWVDSFGTSSTTTINNEELTITYDVDEGSEYIDWVEKDYSKYEHSLLQQVIKRNITKATVTINSYTLQQLGGGAISGNVPDNVQLEAEITTKRFLDIDENVVNKSYVPYIDLTNRYCNFRYPFVPGAEYYEIEWLFISDGSITGDHRGEAIPIDFKDANRIRVKTNYYALPLEFSRGSLIHRYRIVGLNVSGEYSYSQWSYTPTTPTISAISTDQINGNGNNYFYYYIDNGAILNDGLNWEYTSVFAEDGLRKDQLRFFDGLGRDKQTVSLLSSDGNAVVMENEYDYAGRPSFQLMPAPVASQGLQYYNANPAFNHANHFSDTRLDKVIGSAAETPAVLNVTAMANQYYSSANTINSHFRDVIPNAQGFAYSQAQYDNNGTGRIIQQGGLGSAFALKSGRNKKYIYGRPTQEELDRLFGNEAGLAINYTKDYVIDENGQISITYKDGSDRIVATSLSGSTPTGMDPLARDPEEIVANLFQNKTEISNSVFEDFTIVTVAIPNTYTFQYSLDDYTMRSTCLSNEENPGVSGEFEIEISLIDVRTGESEMNYSGSYTSSTEPLNPGVQLTLEPGSYLLKRSIKPSHNTTIAQRESLKEILLNPAYIELNLFPNCVIYSVGTVEDNCSEPNCSTSCVQSFTIEIAGQTMYLDENGGTHSSYDPNNASDLVTIAITNCQDACDKADRDKNDVDFCFIKYNQIKKDLSPGGQYFENIAPRLHYDVDGSILLGTDGKPNYNSSINWYNWMNTTFTNVAGFVTEVGASSSITTWDHVKTNWNDAWGDIIASKHPEYCSYQTYCECINANALGLGTWDYMNRMNREHTDAYATSDPLYPLFNPLNLGLNGTTNNDPHVDHSTYINYAPSNYDSIIVGGSSFVTSHSLCEAVTNTANDPYGLDQMGQNIINSLKNFITFTPTNSGTPVSHSIWYVMEDPDGIADANGRNQTHLPQEVITFYNQLHGSSTVGNPMFDISSKYEFFRSVYLFYREMALYNLVKENGVCSPHIQDLDRNDYDGLTAAQNGWRLVYPANTIYDNFSSFANLANLQQYYSDNLPDAPEDEETRNCLCDKLEEIYNENDNDWNLVEGYLLAQIGSSPSPSELLGIYTDCQAMEYPKLNLISSNPFFKACLYGEGFDGTASMAPTYDSNACATAAQEAAEQIAMAQYISDVDNVLDQIMTDYIEDCRQQVLTKESFSLRYEIDEYQFTLYYYDQAGNLVRTIPPDGTNIIKVEPQNPGDPELSDVADYRDDPQHYDFVHPNHDYQTNYRYNTLNQLIKQFTPDAGETKFWYDKLGRIVLAQNAKQTNSNHYSYTFYDNLGRTVEGGQCIITTAPSFGELVEEDFLLNNVTNRTQVTHSLYDQEYVSVSTNINQEYLQNRVSATFYFNSVTATLSDVRKPGLDASGNFIYPFSGTNGVENAYLYNYDVLGNVKTLYAYSKDLSSAGHSYITLTYEYDLLSGSIKKVGYEPETNNAFYHRYSYDADNRIKFVETSPNNEIWDREVAYYYYPHGPLARVEMGEHLIQGQDFAYTLQGWLKAVNGSTLGTNDANNSYDLGNDGKVGANLNQYVGQDVFAYSLAYFSGDYDPIGTFSNNPIVANIPGAISANDLYTGNISAMSNQMKDNTQTPIEAHLNSYRYDQLNRIKAFNSYTGGLLTSSNNATGVSTGSYAATYNYDANGNLSFLSRKEKNGTTIDQLNYAYTDASVPYKRNRLKSLSEGASNQIGNDIQAGSIYMYDAVGNLISDSGEGITSIDWTFTNKVSSVNKSNGDQIQFTYDGLGNRVEKEVPNSGGGTNQTFYIRDAQGNTMATYSKLNGQNTATLDELNIFGSDRSGVWDRYSSSSMSSTSAKYVRKLSHKNYELKNHLGNVLAVVSDAPLLESDAFVVDHNFSDGTTMNWVAAGANNTLGKSPTILSNDGQKLLVETTTDYGNAILQRDLVAGETYTFRFDLGSYSGPGALPYPTQIRIIIQDRTTGVSTITSSITSGTGSQSISFTVPTTTQLRNIWMMVLVPGSHRTQAFHYTIDNAQIESQNPEVYKETDVISYQDYYPFGMTMPGRFVTGNDHRYGFNGMEKDNEIKGDGNSYDFGARIYDSRIGRWLSIDPLAAKYPEASPYNYALNNPILYYDLGGEDVHLYLSKTPVGTAKIRLIGSEDVDGAPATVNVDLYELTVTDDVTGTTSTYHVTRDAFTTNSSDPIDEDFFSEDEFNVQNTAFEPKKNVGEYNLVPTAAAGLGAYALRNKDGSSNLEAEDTPIRTGDATGVMIHVGGTYTKDGQKYQTGSLGCFTLCGKDEGNKGITNLVNDINNRKEANKKANAGTNIDMKIEKRDNVDWELTTDEDGDLEYD